MVAGRNHNRQLGMMCSNSNEGTSLQLPPCNGIVVGQVGSTEVQASRGHDALSHSEA
jgi:hypothetical protein